MSKRDDKGNSYKHGSPGMPELVNAAGLAFSLAGLSSGSSNAAVEFDAFGTLGLQGEDGWIDVRDFVRLTLTGEAATQDQAVTVEYRTHDEDSGGDLVAETVIDSGDRTELLTAEDIEHVAAVRVQAKYDSTTGGTLTVGGVLK